MSRADHRRRARRIALLLSAILIPTAFVGCDDAADIVHEAFVRARVFPGSFRHQASTATWRTRILLNAAIDETRRMKRRPSCVSDPDASLIERGGVPLHVARLDLKAALAASNGIDREVLVLAACAVRSRGLPTDEPLVLSGPSNVPAHLRTIPPGANTQLITITIALDSRSVSD